MKLVVPRFGEVGIGFVVKAHPSKQWLRVNILAFFAKFILVQPSSIVSNIENFFLKPRQRNCSFLRDAFNRTVFWRAGDVLALALNSPMDGVEYVCLESWIGLEIHRLNPFDVVLALGKDFCSDLEEYF